MASFVKPLSFLLFFAVLLYCYQSIASDSNAKPVSIRLNTGEIIQGKLLKDSAESLLVKTHYGEMNIPKENVQQISYLTKQAVEKTKHSDEEVAQPKQMIDIWFDPTGYTLNEGDFYFSVLSWGFGYSDKLQITTAWYKYFVGDLNMRAKYQVFEKGTFSSGQALAVGFHLHTASLPDKYEFKSYERKEKGYYDDTQDTFIDKERTITVEEWVRVGSAMDDDGHYENDSGFGLWGEVFGAYTWSFQRESGQRVNITVGASGIYYPDAEFMPRVYIAAEMNIHQNIKVLGELFYDPFYQPMYYGHDEDVDIPVFLDVGFMTNKLFGLEDLWLGIHFQKPIISGFYRF